MSKDDIPKLFILPRDTSPNTRIITLNHPRTSTPSRYLFCPEKGIYEFTKFAAPKANPRSLLLARTDQTSHRTSSSGSPIHHEHQDPTTTVDPSSSKSKRKDKEGSRIDISKGYMTKSAELFIATPMDPLFLILPALQPASIFSEPSSSSKQLFRSFEDYIDSFTSSSSSSKHLSHILQSPTMQVLFEMRMNAVCDSVEAGDEKMYRLSFGKLCREILRKASKMVGVGLPASLEEKFVKRALEVPMPAVVKSHPVDAPPAEGEEEEDGNDAVTTGSNPTPIPVLEKDESNLSENTGTVASLSRTISLVSSGSTVATSITTAVDPLSPPTPSAAAKTTITEPSKEIIHLLRLRTATEYLTRNYLPSHLHTIISSMIFPTNSSQIPSSSSPTTENIKEMIDFTPLQTHLTFLQNQRQSHSLLLLGENNYSRKRTFEVEEEEDERKKRIKEEEEKKKLKEKSISRGVRDLKKVDTKGMKKLSSFFTPGGAGGGGGGKMKTKGK